MSSIHVDDLCARRQCSAEHTHRIPPTSTCTFLRSVFRAFFVHMYLYCRCALLLLLYNLLRMHGRPYIRPCGRTAYPVSLPVLVCRYSPSPVYRARDGGWAGNVGDSMWRKERRSTGVDGDGTVAGCTKENADEVGDEGTPGAEEADANAEEEETPVTVTYLGGTNVSHSPPIDHVEVHVHKP